MGYRDDDILDDERADAQMRRALQRIQALDQLAPPPDLVTRSARRLPDAPPAVAARVAARRRLLRSALALAALGLIALLALVGLASLVGGSPLVARLFGDGGAGLSRGLLMIQLLAKPLWHSLGAAPFVSGLVALAGAAWLWWWALRRTPVYLAENAP